MTREESYKETKVCPCVCCGKDVTVTKFASAAKVMCDDCKKAGRTPDPNLVAGAAKAKRMESRSRYGADTKVCKCIKCGKDVTVTKFASAAKVLCDECKGESTGFTSYTGEPVTNPVIHLDRIDRNVVPKLEDYTVTPALFKNPALRQVTCPACGHQHMKILKVMDWSAWGLIIHYQCTKCKLLVSVSEQTKQMVHYKLDSDAFDYSGEMITSTGLSAVEGSRMSMALMKLINLCKEHNIPIEGDEIPPYLYDEVRPVPVGYRIPKGDQNIKAVDDAIKLMQAISKVDEPDALTELQQEASGLVDRLKNLFNEEA